MFTEKQLLNYADVLLWGLITARKEKFKKNDTIIVQFDPAATRLAELLYARIIDMGLHPVHRLNLTVDMERSFFERSSDKQLVFQVPGSRELMENLNGAIHLRAPESLTHLCGVDPKRIGKAAVARKPLRDILDHREAAGAFGWTLCMFPTLELARAASMTPEEYADQIAKACWLDADNPVEEWKAIYKNVHAIKRWLNSLDVRSYHIESEHTDLHVTPGEKRKWVGLSGHNIPSFEIFLSPDWRGTEGVYYADQPSYRSGNFVEGVRLEFRKGSAVSITAKTGEDFVVKQLAMDKGANKVGEFSLTDTRFSKIDRFMANTLFDENFGGEHGNCHLAVGSSYADTYADDPSELDDDLKRKLGFNDSALHWDLVNTESKRVTAHLASGKRTVIYENGKFSY